MHVVRHALIPLLFLCTVSCAAQVVTTETKTSRDSATGKTTTTYATTVSTSEDITPRRNMLVINPLKFFLFYNLSYFRAVSPAIAVGGGVQFPTISGLGGFGVNAETRFYPSERALRGFYAAPNVSYNTLSIDDESASAYSIGILIGWQWFPGDDFAMGLGIGVDYYKGSSDHEDFLKYDGTSPALRFDIGYAW